MVSVEAPWARLSEVRSRYAAPNTRQTSTPQCRSNSLSSVEIEGVAQHLGEVFVPVDDAALQGELADHAILIVVKLGDGAGTVLFQLGYLRQVAGINEEQSAGCSGCSSQNEEQNENDTADKTGRGVHCGSRLQEQLAVVSWRFVSWRFAGQKRAEVSYHLPANGCQTSDIRNPLPVMVSEVSFRAQPRNLQFAGTGTNHGSNGVG